MSADEHLPRWTFVVMVGCLLGGFAVFAVMIVWGFR